MLTLVSNIIFVALVVTALPEPPSSTLGTSEVNSTAPLPAPLDEIEKPSDTRLQTLFPISDASEVHRNNECPADDGQDLRLNTPLVQQQNPTSCGPAIGESLFRHLGISNRRIIISPIQFGPERNLLTLPLQDLLAFSMYYECDAGVRSAGWTGTLNRIIEATMENYGGLYHEFHYAIPESGPFPDARELFRGINHLIRTSLRSNMPVAMGVRFPNPPPNGPQGHFILIDSVNGGDAESGNIVYRHMDPASGTYHENSAEEMFNTAGRQFVLIAFIPGFGSHLPHPQPELLTVEAMEVNLLNEYVWVNFDCDTKRNNIKNITSDNIQPVTCINHCATLAHPYWEDRDTLYTYKDSHNNYLCYIKFRTSTAVAIAQKKSSAVFEFYLTEVLRNIKWGTDVPETNHNHDVEQALSYIAQYNEYFRFKAAQIITQPQYRAIEIVADCGKNTYKPEKGIYLIHDY